ncbi:30S ribosomal protein S18 [bacterium]|nr:30S ribosomal protein S18 [bacterium]
MSKPKPTVSATGQKLVRSTGKRVYPGVPKGYEPRPAFIDYKDVAGLKRFITAQGKLMSRKRTGLSAAGQKALSAAVKRARFMALFPYVAE